MNVLKSSYHRKRVMNDEWAELINNPLLNNSAHGKT